MTHSEQNAKECREVKEPKLIGYITERCEKCGRFRVEIYDNKHLICEKCNWNHTTKQYSVDRDFI